MKTVRLDPLPGWLARGPAARVLALLDDAGEEARVVGGAVRNHLMGVPVGDVDIATTATPDIVMARARDAGFKAVPTGIDHGTVIIVVDGQPVEVTTLRADVATDGRHAEVRFTRAFEEDAARRDFTINALYLARDGTLHDPVGGMEDIAVRRVRFIGDPGLRIAEDYLRILRFFRFFAAYGEGAPDLAALEACAHARAGLDRLSRERIGAEMMKLVIAPRAGEALAFMSDTEILQACIPTSADPARFERLCAIEAWLARVPDAALRLAALSLSKPEDAARLQGALRLSGLARARFEALMHRAPALSPDGGESAWKEALYRLKPQTYTDRALFGWAASGDPVEDARWQVLATLPERWTPPVFPLTGADLIAEGFAPGPELGAELARREQAWVDGGFTLP